MSDYQEIEIDLLRENLLKKLIEELFVTKLLNIQINQDAN